MLVAARLRLDPSPHLLDPVLAAEVDLPDDSRPDVVVLADPVGDEGAVEVPGHGPIRSEVAEELFADEPHGSGLVSGVSAIASPAILLGPRDDAGVDGVESDVAADVEQLGFLFDQTPWKRPWKR
jgi:hypothetical protein